MTGILGKVLVAEDNSALNRIVYFVLAQEGYEVTPVRNGQDAWQALIREDFGLLVTDEQMPGLTGRELCCRLRQEPRLLGLPVVMLTARGLELDANELSRELGISALLYKPFSPRELVQLAQRHMRSHCKSV